jgi:parvulin-like peptidyl-prolyl isomerase
MRTTKKIYALMFALLAMPGISCAELVARVEGHPVYREDVEYFAVRILSYAKDEGKGGDVEAPKKDKAPITVTKEIWEDAFKKYVTNILLTEKARKEIPRMVESAERQAEFALAAEYFKPYSTEIAFPRAKEEVTVQTVLLEIPPQLPSVVISQISMAPGREQELEALRQRIVKKEITFEEAAKKHSNGLTASKGGDVGGVRNDDARYAPTVLSAIFATPKGEITPVLQLGLGPAIIWVREKLSAEELAVMAAKKELPDRIKAQVIALCWNDAGAYQKNHGGEFLLTDANVKEKAAKPDEPAFRLDGKTYLVGEVAESSGGASHGSKDVLTIAENRYRDIALQKLYIEKKGMLERHEERYRMLANHLAARQYLAYKSRDITIADEAVDAYLAENNKKYRLPNRADFGIIFVRTEDRVKTVMERLAKGEDFETLAKAWSQDTTTAPSGGRVGVLPLSNFKGKLEDVKEGVVLGPEPMEKEVMKGKEKVKEKGFIITKIYKFYPEEPGTRANLGPQAIGGIRSILLSRVKGERLTTLMQGVLKAAKVEIVKQ